MNFDSDQASITPVSQSYLKIDTTGALWIPTGSNAQRPSSPSAGFFRYNTDTPGLEYWNGAAWTAAGAGGGGSGAVDTAEVTWVFTKSQCRIALNESTMVIDLTKLCFDLTGAYGSPSFAAGQTVFLVPETDQTKTGIYTLGSVASLNAVTLTRHSDWGASKAIKRGTRIFAVYHPDFTKTDVSGNFGASDINISTEEIGSVYGFDANDVGLTLVGFGSLDSGAVMPGGLAINTVYQIQAYDEANGLLKVSSTLGGGAQNITSTGTDGSGFRIASYFNVNGPYTDKSAFIELFGDFPSTAGSFTFGGLAGICLSKTDIFKNNNLTGISLGGGSALGDGATSVGRNSYAFGTNSVTLGFDSTSRGGGVAVGAATYGIGGVAVGALASAVSSGVAIGGSAQAATTSTAIGYSVAVLSPSSIAIGSGAGTGGYPEVGFNQDVSLSIGQDLMAGNGSIGLLYTKAFGSTSNATETAMSFGSNTFSQIESSGIWQLNGYLSAYDGTTTDSCMWKVEGFANLAGTDTFSDVRLTRIASTTSTIAKSLKARVELSYNGGASRNELKCYVTGSASQSFVWWLYLGGVLIDTRYSINEHLASSHVAIKTGVAKAITTSEALSAGNIVNLHNSSGLKCRKASASLGYEAHGFVLEDVSSGGTAMVFTDGENPYLSSLTVGPLFLSSTSGGVTSTVYSTSGYLVQPIGYAMSSTKMSFQAGTAVMV